MNIAEATTQLNQERKRKENFAWQKFLATDNKKTTQEKLRERTLELDQIRSEYEKSLAQINFEFNAEQIKRQRSQFTDQENNSTVEQQSQSLQSFKDRGQGVLQGAENLPENKPIVNEEASRKRKIDGIQKKDDTSQEPDIVRNARQQNKSDQIRQNEQIEGMFNDSDATPDEKEIEEKKALAIRNEFRKSGINLSEITNAKSDSDLIKEVTESKKTALIRFPIIILFIAVLKDCSDILSSILESIPAIGVIIWFFAAGFSLLCSIVIWFWMLGKGSRMQRKIIINFVRNRLPIILAGLLGEFIPWVSLIPTTTITVFFIAQTSTRLGQTIHKAVEKAEVLKS